MNKLKLLKYHKGSKYENNEIFTIAREYRTSIGMQICYAKLFIEFIKLYIRVTLKFVFSCIGLSAWSGFSWLSGSSNDSFDFDSFNASGSWKWNGKFKYQNQLQYFLLFFVWLLILFFYLQDKLTQDKEKEKCLVLTKDGVRPVMCDLTNYFLCYAARPIITTTPAPVPTTEDNELGRANSNDTNITGKLIVKQVLVYKLHLKYTHIYGCKLFEI